MKVVQIVKKAAAKSNEGLPVVQLKEWNEADHPRDPAGSSTGGQFTSGGGGGGGGGDDADAVSASPWDATDKRIRKMGFVDSGLGGNRDSYFINSYKPSAKLQRRGVDGLLEFHVDLSNAKEPKFNFSGTLKRDGKVVFDAPLNGERSLAGIGRLLSTLEATIAKKGKQLPVVRL